MNYSYADIPETRCFFVPLLRAAITELSREQGMGWALFIFQPKNAKEKQHLLQILEKNGGAAIQLFWLPPCVEPSVSNTHLSQMCHSCFPFPMPLHYPTACLGIGLPTSTCSQGCAVLGGG